jgi:hypothetical protein
MFRKKKPIPQMSISQFKTELRALVDIAREAGNIHWKELAWAIEAEARGLHEYHALHSPIY